MLMSWVKRFVPFFLAFALGLFIASFFVSVGFPKVNKFERRGWKHYEHNCRMRSERDNLRYQLESVRRENDRLRDEMRINRDFGDFEIDVPPPPLPPSRVR